MSHRHSTFQAGAQVGVFVTLLIVQASFSWDSGLAYPHFLHEVGGDKVEHRHGGGGGDNFSLKRCEFLPPVHHSDKVLASLWVLLLQAQSQI